jgi:hypothetical protein
MFVLKIISDSGEVLWTEDYRTPESLFYRAPDAIETGDGCYDSSVDDLVMVPLQSRSYNNPNVWSIK